ANANQDALCGPGFDGDLSKYTRSGLTHGQVAAKVVSHGIAGGVMSSLQGGKFGHGFVSAGINESVSAHIGGVRTATGQAVASAVVGGTTSALTGGKFANGALTAAFATIYNHWVHDAWKARAVDLREDYIGRIDPVAGTETLEIHVLDDSPAIRQVE